MAKQPDKNPRDAASAHQHIGIVFEPPALYPPLKLHQNELAVFTSLLPEMNPADFDYALNSVPGDVLGIYLGVSGRFGTVTVFGLFLDDYPGPWPARLEVRHLKNGVPTDLGVLRLLDTRTAVPVRLAVEVTPTTVAVPPAGETRSVHCLATLFDAANIPLPFDPDTWDVHLDAPTEGVTLEGNLVYVSADAKPGSVQLRITAKPDFEETVTVTLT